MKPKLVRIARTFNMGNYRSLRIEWEAEAEEEDRLEALTDDLVSSIEEYGLRKHLEVQADKED